MERDLVSIKGTRNGLVIVLEPNREFEEIKNNLLRKMESARGFFKGAKFTFLQGQKRLPAEQVKELVEICCSFGMVPSVEVCPDKTTAPVEKKSFATHTPAGAEPAILVRKTLRSGQAVSHRHHIVIIGDVHPGAEVISGGSVIVLGNCLGAVHAGAGGNNSAIVAALHLCPTMLSIAGLRYSKNGEEKSSLSGFQVVRLKGHQMVFENYHLKSSHQ